MLPSNLIFDICYIQVVDSTQIFVRTSREQKTNKYSDIRPRVENVSRYAENTFIVDENVCTVASPLICVASPAKKISLRS